MRARRTVGKRTSTSVVPSVSFSSDADPSAMMRPWSMTTMWSARPAASSRYWVVNSSRVLAGEADGAPHGVRLAGDVEAEHRRVAGVGPQERGEDTDGGGLAGAVRAQEPEDGAGRNLEVDSVEGGEVAEALHDPVDDDCVLVGHEYY